MRIRKKKERLLEPLRGDGPMWTCHFCGDLRLDENIEVMPSTRWMGQVEVRHTRRYCRDKVECRTQAMEWATSEHPERWPFVTGPSVKGKTISMDGPK